MPQAIQERLTTVQRAIRRHLTEGIVPFWRERAIDAQHGGYLTHFNARGELAPLGADKYLTTQMRLVWWFSTIARQGIDPATNAERARQGVVFMRRYFWDAEYGGWFWRVTQKGDVVDTGKSVYGQSFAIYALSEHALLTGDSIALELARKTFDWLQIHAADTRHGGYFEHLERDGSVSTIAGGVGRRKSLDTHMHLLEAFTVLLSASRLDVHQRKLREVRAVILERMIDQANGCGGNQYDEAFLPLTAATLPRTWNAERPGSSVLEPTDTTSYGHNLELAWLLMRARETLGEPAQEDRALVTALTDHALAYGVDHERGGVYRDGPHQGPALVRDKEFWQNAEALVGLLSAYTLNPRQEYLHTFIKLWDFVSAFMIHPTLGEWLTLVDEAGSPISSELGSHWKVSYHTGRAMIEALSRLDAILPTLERD